MCCEKKRRKYETMNRWMAGERCATGDEAPRRRAGSGAARAALATWRFKMPL
jgi:hypothetical protein